jgi:hypothetical protein
MQLPIRVFAALFLAHLLGDFPLQPHHLRLAKRRHWWASALHGLIHGALLLICLIYFAPPFEVFHWRVFLWASCYIALHLLIDVAKGRFPEDSIAAFSIDQTLHLATVFGLALLLTQLRWQSLHSLLAVDGSTKDHLLSGAIVYTTVIFAGGYLIRYLTRGLVRQIPFAVVEPPEQMKNAGLYIGWLERLLVVSAVVLRSPALMGLILTGKSIARFPEMKEPKFAEYFLIGTLLSLAIALFGGLLLLKLWNGAVSFQQ